MFGLGKAAAEPAFPPYEDFDELDDLPDAEESPRPSRWRWRMRALAAVLLLFMAIIAWLAITAPLSQSLEPVTPPRVTLLSEEGTPIARRGAIIDAPVVIDALPDYVPAAFLAIEDRRFYSHWGIDPRGILRAAWRNARAGGVREGGSTITQQLAKVAFLNANRTATRKMQEVLIAFWLEAWLSKDDILARYLSNVYFGDNVYGLRAASLHYFNRDPEQLTLSQAALLAGLLKAPSRLAPTVNLKGARDRAEIVLAAMARHGFITEGEAERARPASLNLRPVRSLPSGTYFADWVLPEARDRAGSVYAEQKVDTTLDAGLQRLAERVVRRAGLGKAQVAMVAMRPDGRVVAMVGGRNYADSPFNRATQARRQPGSTFKLFVYLAALRSGMTPETMIDDEPLTIGDWSPRNSDGRYRGRITLKQAFAASSNVAAVRLAEKVGRSQVIRAARDLGIESPLGSDASLALGTSSVTLLELTSAYAAVAANRYPVRPHGLPELERSWFDRLSDRQSAFSDDTQEMLRDLLWSAANEGTGRSAALRARTYGKTGTTQDNRDAIFVGFAGDLVTAVWVGNDDNSPLRGVAGGGLPARIWRDFMAGAIDSVPRNARPAPPAPVPAADEGDDASLTAEIGGIRIELEPESVTLSTDSLPGNNSPGPADRPTITLPLPSQPPEGGNFNDNPEGQ